MFEISHNQLKKLFYYDAGTGIFVLLSGRYKGCEIGGFGQTDIWP